MDMFNNDKSDGCDDGTDVELNLNPFVNLNLHGFVEVEEEDEDDEVIIGL